MNTAATTVAPENTLLEAFLCSTQPLADFLKEQGLALHELLRACTREKLEEAVERITRLHEARARVQLILGAKDAAEALRTIAANPSPTTASEITRRAANTILKLAFPKAAPAPKVAPASRPVSPPPPPTPPPSPTKPSGAGVPPASTKPSPSPSPSTPRHLDTSTPSASPSVPMSPCPSVPSSLPSTPRHLDTSTPSPVPFPSPTTLLRSLSGAAPRPPTTPS